MVDISRICCVYCKCDDVGRLAGSFVGSAADHVLAKEARSPLAASGESAATIAQRAGRLQGRERLGGYACGCAWPEATHQPAKNQQHVCCCSKPLISGGSMSDYQRCPNCGHKPDSWGASHMDVYQCDICRTTFCHRCPGSNGGRECPRCSSTRYRVVGRVYK